MQAPAWVFGFNMHRCLLMSFPLVAVLLVFFKFGTLTLPLNKRPCWHWLKKGDILSFLWHYKRVQRVQLGAIWDVNQSSPKCILSVWFFLPEHKGFVLSRWIMWRSPHIVWSTQQRHWLHFSMHDMVGWQHTLVPGNGLESPLPLPCGPGCPGQAPVPPIPVLDKLPKYE